MERLVQTRKRQSGALRTVKEVITVRLACNRQKLTYRSPLLATVVIGDAPDSIGEY